MRFLIEDPGTFLPLKELALAIHTPSVSRQVAIAPHHTVAGNGYCQVIRPAGLSNRAHGFRFSDALGDIGIAHRCAHRNLSQRLPDAFLERRPLEIQWQLEAALRRFDPTARDLDKIIDFAKTRKDAFLKFVPSGVATVAELQGKGFAYMKIG